MIFFINIYSYIWERATVENLYNFNIQVKSIEIAKMLFRKIKIQLHNIKKKKNMNQLIYTRSSHIQLCLYDVRSSTAQSGWDFLNEKRGKQFFKHYLCLNNIDFRKAFQFTVMCMCLIPIWLYCRLPLKINHWYLPMVEDILCKFRSIFLFLLSRPRTLQRRFIIDEFHLYSWELLSYCWRDYTYIGKGWMFDGMQKACQIQA